MVLSFLSEIIFSDVHQFTLRFNYLSRKVDSCTRSGLTISLFHIQKWANQPTIEQRMVPALSELMAKKVVIVRGRAPPRIAEAAPHLLKVGWQKLLFYTYYQDSSLISQLMAQFWDLSQLSSCSQSLKFCGIIKTARADLTMSLSSLED